MMPPLIWAFQRQPLTMHSPKLAPTQAPLYAAIEPEPLSFLARYPLLEGVKARAVFLPVPEDGTVVVAGRPLARGSPMPPLCSLQMPIVFLLRRSSVIFAASFMHAS
jgi:hypothetical protein